MRSVVFTIFSLVTTLAFIGVMLVYLNNQMEITGQAISEELENSLTGGSIWEEDFVNKTEETNEPMQAVQIQNEEPKTTQVQSAPSSCGCAGG